VLPEFRAKFVAACGFLLSFRRLGSVLGKLGIQRGYARLAGL